MGKVEVSYCRFVIVPIAHFMSRAPYREYVAEFLGTGETLGT
jgi:hypothetical protein